MFFSKELADAFQKSQEALDTFVQDITHISKDMRFLELLLKNYSIHLSFHYLFTHEIEKLEETLHIYEYISWEINEKEKKPSFRLFYKKYESTENIESIEVLASTAKLVESRPLVETPLLVRLKIYPFLPTFLDKLTEELSRQKYKMNFSTFAHSITEFEKSMKSKPPKKS